MKCSLSCKTLSYKEFLARAMGKMTATMRRTYLQHLRCSALCVVNLVPLAAVGGWKYPHSLGSVEVPSVGLTHKKESVVRIPLKHLQKPEAF